MPKEKTHRPRSWMFVPGNKERFLEKAPRSGADAILSFLAHKRGLPKGGIRILAAIESALALLETQTAEART